MSSGIFKIKSNDSVREVNVKNMSETNAPNFIWISLSSMKKSSVNFVHQLFNNLMNANFINQSLLIVRINHQKLFVVLLFFDKNKGVKIINFVRNLDDPEIVSSLPTTP